MGSNLRASMVKKVALQSFIQLDTEPRDTCIYQCIEFAANRFICAFWSAGFRIVERSSGSLISIEGERESSPVIEDPNPLNENCRTLQFLPGFDPDHYPFLISRSAMSINLINLNRLTIQPLIHGGCDLEWYQKDSLVLVPVYLPHVSENLAFDMLWVSSVRSGNSESHRVRRFLL